MLTKLRWMYHILLNRLYNDTFIIISFTMFLNLVATVCSPNILLIDENTVSAIHLCPYFLFFFHFSKSFVCCITSLFLNLLFLGEITEFFLTFIASVILFFCRYWNSYLYHELRRPKQILSLSYEVVEKEDRSLKLDQLISSSVYCHVSSHRLPLVLGFVWSVCLQQYGFWDNLYSFLCSTCHTSTGPYLLP